MFQKTLLVFIVIVIGTTLVFAAEMVAFKSLDETFFNGYQGQQDLEHMLMYYQHLGEQGLFAHESWGMGFTYHLGRNPHTEPGIIIDGMSTSISPRRYAANYTSGIFLGNGDAFIPNSRYLEIFGEIIPYDNFGTVFMHKRDFYTSPNLFQVDQQPFVYRDVDNSRSYSFMHEGTFSQNQLLALIQFYILHPNLVDSEITALMLNSDYSGHLFAYILLRIKEHNMDILRGIHSAVVDIVRPGNILDYSPHNFIFSDGFDLYVFCFDTSSNLRIYRDDDRMITMITSHNEVQTLAQDNLDLVFTDDDLYPIPYKSLVYLPFHGDPIRFEQFIYPPVVKMLRPVKTMGNPNWLCFPVLPDVIPPNIKITDQITNGLDNVVIISSEDGTSITYLPIISDWFNPANAFTDIATPEVGVQIAYFDPGVDIMSTIGAIQPIAIYNGLGASISPLPPNDPILPYRNGRWVAYNLASSQSIQDALGPFFSSLKRVVGENWAWDPSLPSGNIMAQKPMEFGKMYQLYTTATMDFYWTDIRKTRNGSVTLNEPANGKLNRKSQYFTYIGQDRYEAIDVMSLSSYQGDCTEIGVFAGNTCVGATRVDDFPVQVLAYTKEYEDIPLTFKILLNNGRVVSVNPVVAIYNRNTGGYDDEYLIAGDIGHTAVMLNVSNDITDIKIPVQISKHQVYPNPFNPSTTISFNITDKSNVAVEVYNIRGQKVNTLLNDSLPAGNHFILWNGTDNRDRNVSSGIYFYLIKTDNHQITGKMILMK